MNNATMTEIKVAPYWTILPEFRLHSSNLPMNSSLVCIKT